MVDQFRWDLDYHYFVYQVREGDPRFPWSIGVDLVLVRLGWGGIPMSLLPITEL